MTYLHKASNTLNSFVTLVSADNTRLSSVDYFSCLSVLLKYGLFFTSLVLSQLAIAQRYVIALPEPFEQDANKSLVTSFFDLAYEGLDVKPEYIYLPFNRATQLFNEGKLDAIGSRVLSRESSLKAAIRVQKPFALLEFIQICLRKLVCDTRYDRNIGTLQNLKSVKEVCQRKSLMCGTEHSVSSLLRSLEEGLIDSIVLTSNSTAQHICLFNDSDIYFRKVEDIKIPIYHYLNEKNQHFAPHLSQAFESAQLSNKAKLIKSFWLSASRECGKTLVEI